MPNKNTIKAKIQINEIYEKVQRDKEMRKKEKEIKAFKDKESELGLVKDQDDNSEANTSILKVLERDRRDKEDFDKKFETKRKLFKEFFVFLSQKLDIKICDYIERDETEEETRKRMEEKELEERNKAEMNNDKNKKGKDKAKWSTINKNIDLTPIDIPLIVRELRLTNLDLSERYNKWAKWVASQLQIINDMNILNIHVSYLSIVIYTYLFMIIIF